MDIEKEQKIIANKLRIKICKVDTKNTLAAKILDEVANSIKFKPQEPSTFKQIEFSKKLKIKDSFRSKRVLSAKISDKLDDLNRKILKQLKLKPGDIVSVKSQFGNCEKEHIVSSIKENGKIYFKGMSGNQAWASNINKVIKRI